MKNEVFSFRRFWTYFTYDFVQLGRRHGKSALLIAGSGLVFYVIWIAGSLVFSHRWAAPEILGRMVVALFALTALELFYAYLYGFVTDRRKGASYLMVPASTTEKFVSVLVNAIIVVPLLFLLVHLGLDALICLLDPTADTPLVTGGMKAFRQLVAEVETLDESSFIFSSLSRLVVLMVLGNIFNNLYFLLCGMCFRKNKILSAILISMGVSFVLSLISGVFAPQLSSWISDIDLLSQESVKVYAKQFFSWSIALTAVLDIAIGWGIFYRLKTLKH